MQKFTTSIIVTTYNWPSALGQVLIALNAQNTLISEVIVADDGSKPDTTQYLKSLEPQLNYPLIHIWQPDEGFRAAKIRNQAAAKASGDYLIFLDGDCIPQKSFVRRHQQLAEKKFFTVGNRILLNSKFTQKVLNESLDLYDQSFFYWCQRRWHGECNRLLPLLKITVPGWRKLFRKAWDGAKTCNLALWKEDFLQVNGFDEAFQGWGYEDSDLVVRLIRAGVFRKSGRFAVPVFHLDHKHASRTAERENYTRLEKTLKENHIRARVGVDQY